jgi:hypothetical protein
VHDVDAGWVEDVKRKGGRTGTKIVPRLLFENWRVDDFVKLFRDRDKQKNLLNIIVQGLKVSHISLFFP